MFWENENLVFCPTKNFVSQKKHFHSSYKPRHILAMGQIMPFGLNP